jgi:hypothetical protein
LLRPRALAKSPRRGEQRPSRSESDDSTREAWIRGGVECGRMPTSTGSSGIGGGAVGRRGSGAAMGGREDEAAANGRAPTRYDRCQVSNGISAKKGKDTPNRNQLSNFDGLNGRLGELWEEGRRAGRSSFLGDVGRDQGATGRPKSGLERRFSLDWVGWGPDAKAGTGGGGMRGSYVINGSATPIPESLM